MNTCTLVDVLNREPCDDYMDPDTGEATDLLLDLFGCRESLSVADGFALYDEGLLPAADILWWLLDESMLPALILHEAACRFAERALLIVALGGDETDERSWKAIRTKRAWMRGYATDEDLFAARSDAARAAAEAVREAAWAAAWAAAAWAAAWTAAQVAALATSRRVAARAAAEAEARAAEEDIQVGVLRELIEEREGKEESDAKL